MPEGRTRRWGAVAVVFGESNARGMLLAVLSIATVLALAGPLASGALAQGADAEKEAAKLDCDDVATQRGAQALFKISKEDRFGLDRNGDGAACETAPGGKAEDGTALGAKTGGDLDCMDFPSQKAAQERLRKDPSDPYKLDPEHSGIACDIRPTDYAEHATDFAPVARERSGADLNCDDFEFQQEAQMVYFRDKSDPNHLDKGKDGSSVCENLPVLASNAEGITAASAGAQTAHPATGPLAAPLAFVEAWPHGGGLGLLLDLVALILVASGILALLAARRGRPRGSE